MALSKTRRDQYQKLIKLFNQLIAAAVTNKQKEYDDVIKQIKEVLK